MYKVFENVDGIVGIIAETESGPEGRADAINAAKWHEADHDVPAFVMDTNNPDDPVVWGEMFKTIL